MKALSVVLIGFSTLVLVAAEICRCSKMRTQCKTFGVSGGSCVESNNGDCDACRCDLAGDMYCSIEESILENSDCESSRTFVARCPSYQPDESFCNKDKVVMTVEGQPLACITTIKVEDDIEEAYRYDKHETQIKDGLENQYISFRFVKSNKTNTLSFCAIYGQGINGEREGNWGASTANVFISNTYGVRWEVMDDPHPQDNFLPLSMETYTTDLQANHTWKASKSDGWCVGPVTDRGQNFQLRFDNLLNIKGVTVSDFNQTSGQISRGPNWLLATGPGQKPKDFGRDGASLIPLEIKSVRFASSCYCPRA
uniref:Laminin IV type A domain-containing protein n=1 Tax=Compsopogon caeruleus TaxID=31354 RepID=A0A7S1XAL2_9RHOD|mmetsp:Transcript_10430/g.21018  ORF Transcript_10430/g.21018 Transcript_10430/m.21018 type:complete len:311 (+) Transcript_10430:581-1513(+)